MSPCHSRSQDRIFIILLFNGSIVQWKSSLDCFSRISCFSRQVAYKLFQFSSKNQFRSMCTAVARSIPLECLDKLSQAYTKNWPKHIIIHSTLQLFIKQLSKFPELGQRLKLFALSDDWENDGFFYATVSVNCSNENDEILRTTLEKLDYSKLIDFFSVRNEFSSLALRLMKDLNLQCIEETNAICFFLPRHDALNLQIS